MLPKAFRQIIDFAQDTGSQLHAEMLGCGVNSDEGEAGSLQGGMGLEVRDHTPKPGPPKPRTPTPFTYVPADPSPHFSLSCNIKPFLEIQKGALWRQIYHRGKKIAKLISFGNQCYRKHINIGFATLFSSRETL